MSNTSTNDVGIIMALYTIFFLHFAYRLDVSMKMMVRQEEWWSEDVTKI